MRALRVSHSGVVDAWRERERSLRRRGVTVDLVTARAWREGGALVPLTPQPGECVTAAGTVGRHPALFLYDPRPLWHALGRTWDVIDIHEEPFALATAEVLLLRWMRRQRAPYVLYSAQNIDKRYPVPFRWLERAALRGASGLSVCNSEAGRIVERKGFPGRATVIPLGVETVAASTPVPAARSLGHERAGSSGTVRVGFAGRLEAYKGVHVLLEAIAADDRLSLEIAGGGTEDGALRAQSHRLGLTDRVRFVGVLDGPQLAEFYQALDVLAVPSLTTPTWVEQFGRVVVESMAVGTPVVVSDSGALPEVVGDSGLVVPEGDASALSAALVQVGTDRELWEALSRAGLEHARSCSWDAVGKAYADLYDRACHRFPGTADPGKRDVEVVVVAYGQPDLLEGALAALGDLHVIVVDNSSSRDVAAVCRRHDVTYVDPGANLGFAGGVNLGLRHLSSDRADVVLVNPDAVIERASIERLHHALLASDDLASVGPAQTDGKGKAAQVAWPFPSPVRVWLEALGLGRLRVDRPGFVIGSVLLLRREALDQVGELDERFFLYAEETDWAWRATRLGWRHAVVPEVLALHVGAGTSNDEARRERFFHASQERYLRKHFGAAGWQVSRVGQILGAAARAVALRGERRRTASRRALLYLRGPVANEPARQGQAS